MPDDHVTRAPGENGINQAEWDVRVKLAAAYRLVDYYDWTEQIYGHLTARAPGPENHFLINPWGLNYDEVTASNLVKDVIGNDKHPVNFAGFIIHSAIHLTRSEENHVVMHTHTRAGMAIAAIRRACSRSRCSPPFFTTALATTSTRVHRSTPTSAKES
jgi:ribulose-5-phosphate 4-epimerase/fuculose-1-phosphate aldolase